MRVLRPGARPTLTNGEPLRITAQMGEPLVHYRDGLHLDGILSWGAYLEYVREHGDDLPPLARPWAVDFDLPLSTWSVPPIHGVHENLLDERGWIWGWRASAVEADWIAHGRMEVRKRPAMEQMARYTSAKSHNPGAGPLKGRDKAVPTLLAFELRWYAHGARHRVADLLARVHHIGGLSRHGMGRVLRWTVDSMGEDWSVERGGVLMRRMPRAGGTPGAIRAPYHHRSRRVPAVEAGESC